MHGYEPFGIVMQRPGLRCASATSLFSLRNGINELKIDYGPGYRVYYTFKGKTLILLLCGGDKSSQRKDINLAMEISACWGT